MREFFGGRLTIEWHPTIGVGLWWNRATDYTDYRSEIHVWLPFVHFSLLVSKVDGS